MPIPREDSKHFCPLLLRIRDSKEKLTQTLDETALLLHRGQSKVSFNSGHRPPTASRSLPAGDAGQCAYVHTSHATVEGALSPPLGRTDQQWGWSGAIWQTYFKQSQKSPHWAWNRKVFPPKVVSPARAVWALSPGKEVFQTQGPFLCSWMGAGKMRSQDRLSQQISFKCSKTVIVNPAEHLGKLFLNQKTKVRWVLK